MTHNLYPPQELDREKARQAAEPHRRRRARTSESSRTALGPKRAPQASPDELAAIRAEVAALRDQVRALSDEVKELKTALGA